MSADSIDPFQVLGISRDSTLEEAKAEWRLLVELLHPDRLGDARPEVQRAGEDRLKQVNAAWDRVREQLDPVSGVRPPPSGDGASGSKAPDEVLVCVECGQKNRVPESAANTRCGRCGVRLTGADESGDNTGGDDEDVEMQAAAATLWLVERLSDEASSRVGVYISPQEMELLVTPFDDLGEVELIAVKTVADRWDRAIGAIAAGRRKTQFQRAYSDACRAEHPFAAVYLFDAHFDG